MSFTFETIVRPEWIDYNGHMRDSYYGLVFSLAVDSLQDDVGFDEEYRKRSGCTIYLIEDHKYFLKEVKVDARVRVVTNIVNCDAKRFHLHMVMYEGDTAVAAGEFMELHVAQQPKPHAAPMPQVVKERLEAAKLSPAEAVELPYRARQIGFGCKS